MRQTLLEFDRPKPTAKPRPRVPARSVRAAKPLPIAEHADCSQTFAPLVGVRAATFEEQQADGRMRAARCRPPANPLCKLVNQCPPSLLPLTLR